MNRLPRACEVVAASAAAPTVVSAGAQVGLPAHGSGPKIS